MMKYFHRNKKHGRDMPIFRDFKVPRRDRYFKPTRPRLWKIVSRDETCLKTLQLWCLKHYCKYYDRRVT